MTAPVSGKNWLRGYTRFTNRSIDLPAGEKNRGALATGYVHNAGPGKSGATTPAAPAFVTLPEIRA